MKREDMKRDALKSISAVLDNVQAVRGERFAMLVHLAMNLESLARVAVMHGAPTRMVAVMHVAISSVVQGLTELSPEDMQEIDRIVATIHSQIEWK